MRIGWILSIGGTFFALVMVMVPAPLHGICQDCWECDIPWNFDDSADCIADDGQNFDDSPDCTRVHDDVEDCQTAGDRCTGGTIPCDGGDGIPDGPEGPTFQSKLDLECSNPWFQPSTCLSGKGSPQEEILFH